MTIVINDASPTLFQALKELAKLDGATVYADEYGYYSAKTAKSILRADRQMEKQRNRGTLKVYNTVDDMFGDL